MNNVTTERSAKRLVRLISIALYIASLTQKAFCTESNCGDSVLVVIFGGIGMITGGASLIWMANPLILISWFSIRNVKASLIASAISFLTAISFLMFDKIADNEGGVYNRIVSYEAGYWIWVSSITVMLLGNIYLLLLHRKVLKQQ